MDLNKPIVGVVMGSASDKAVMEGCTDTLRELEIPHEVIVSSAHRTPEQTKTYAATAAERGLEVIEIKSAPHRDYISLITVEGSTGSATYSFSGTIFAKDQPRIVRVDGLDVDIALRGPMLICHNLDRPGAISHLTTVLARRRINVARMAVGRDQPGGRAVIILNIDEPVTDEIISEIKGLEIITDVKLVQV